MIALYVTLSLTRELYSFAINVFLNTDLEPPKINCPQNKEVQKKNDIPTVTVYWVAPTYSDNSGLPVKIFTESINGSQFGVGQHRIEYSATDHANHKSTCSFLIVVSRKLARHLLLLYLCDLLNQHIIQRFSSLSSG